MSSLVTAPAPRWFLGIALSVVAFGGYSLGYMADHFILPGGEASEWELGYAAGYCEATTDTSDSPKEFEACIQDQRPAYVYNVLAGLSYFISAAIAALGGVLLIWGYENWQTPEGV